MSMRLKTKAITCKVCCFSTVVIVNDPNEPLPYCERCGAQRWDISASEEIVGLKPIPLIKSLLHTKIF